MNKTVFTLFMLGLIGLNHSYAQVGIGTATPESSSILHLESDSAGFLPPRLTSIQIDNISNPAEGLIIYNTSINQLQSYDGSNWISLGKATELAVDNKSSSFAITSSQDNTLFLVDDAAQVSLPPLNQVRSGFRVYIKRKGFGNVNIIPSNNDSLEGVSSINIGFRGGVVEIVASDTHWELLRSGSGGSGTGSTTCPSGSVSYTTPGQSTFQVTQTMVDNCVFSIQVKGAAGANAFGGAGGGVAFNWKPDTIGTLGVFVGGGGLTAGGGGVGGGGAAAGTGGGGASAVKFNNTVIAIAGGGGGASTREGGAGGSTGAGNNGSGSNSPGGGAPGDGTGGVRTSTRVASGGNAGANGASSDMPGGIGIPSFSIGGGGGGSNSSSSHGGGGGYGGGAAGYFAGAGGGAGFILSDPSITNVTSIQGALPLTTSPNNGGNGSVTIVISPR
ncbi:MAG: hypothetical protein LAT54_08250 [Cryomorphaceae bacterium]|nr:hypothetical protein [Cryomorphaceae bacterium]